jgi:hypothetical protein
MPPRHTALVAFLGPSLPAREARSIAPGCLVLPPARLGDVWRALALRPRALALVDGVFGDVRSVWHHELLDALEAGVAVFGGASMGALRAAELSGHGMVGIGRIFEAYRDGRLTGDDEVALLHGPADLAFRPLTLPLVDVRAAADLGLAEGRLDARRARALVRAAASIFYADRTWRRVLAAARSALGAPGHCWLTRLVAAGPPDPKGADARATLAAAAAFVRSGAPAPRLAPRRPSSLVRRRKLDEGATLTSRGTVPSRAVMAALARGGGATASRSTAASRSAAALRDDGLRRALLAGLARALGIRAGDGERAEALSSWLGARGVRRHAAEAFLAASGLDTADAARLADDLALERHLLRHAAQAVPDGPSDDEGLALGARLAGRWAEVAEEGAKRWGRGETHRLRRSTRSTPRSRGSPDASG